MYTNNIHRCGGDDRRYIHMATEVIKFHKSCIRLNAHHIHIVFIAPKHFEITQAVMSATILIKMLIHRILLWK